MTDTTRNTGAFANNAGDSIVLEEEIDPNYVPSDEEVLEYAKWLGMDLDKDKDMLWIAREGLMAPLPKHWKPCKTKDTDDIYYFNFTSGESTWDHPCDGYYKRLYEDEKKKKEVTLKDSNDEKKNKAKQDVEIMIGKPDKKKKRSSSPTRLDVRQAEPASTSSKMFEKKPLPGIAASNNASSPDFESSKSKVSIRLSGAVDTSMKSKHDTGVESEHVKASTSREQSPSPFTAKAQDRNVTFGPEVVSPNKSKRVGRREKDNTECDKEKSTRQDSNILADEVHSLHMKLQTLREERNQASDERDTIMYQYKNQQQQLQGLEMKLDFHMGESAKRQLELDDAMRLHRQTESDYKHQLDEAKTTLSRSKDANSNLKKDIDAHVSHIEQMKAVATVDSNKEKYDEMKRLLEDMTHERDAMKQALNMSENHNKDAKKKIAESEAEVKNMKQLYDEQSQQLQAEKLNTLTQQESNARMMQMTESLKHEITMKDDLLNKQSKDDVGSRLQSLNTDLQVRIAELDKQLQDIMVERDQLIKERNEMTLSQSSLPLQNDVSRGGNDEDESKQQVLAKQLVERSHEIAKLRSDLHFVSQKQSLAEEEVQSLQGKIHDLEDKNRDLSKDNNMISTSLKEECLKSADAKADATSAKSKLAMVESDLLSKSQAMVQLRHSLDMISADVSSSASVHAKDAIIISELEMKISNLQTQLNLTVEELLHHKSSSLQTSNDMQQHIISYDKKISELNMMINHEQSISEAMRHDNKKLRLQILSNEQMIQDMNMKYNIQYHDMEMKTHDISQKHHNKELEINTMNDIIDDLRAKHRDSMNKVREYQDRSLALQSDLNDALHRNKELSTKLETLSTVNEDHVSSSAEHLIKMEDMLREKSNELSILQTKYTSSFDQISSLRNVIYKMKSDALAMNMRLSELTTETQTMEMNFADERATLLAEKEEALHALRVVEHEIAASKAESISIRDEITSSHAHQTEGVSSSSSQSDRLAEISKLLSKQQAMVERLEAKIDTSKHLPSSSSATKAKHDHKSAKMTSRPSYIEADRLSMSPQLSSDDDIKDIDSNEHHPYDKQDDGAWKSRLMKERLLISKLDKIQQARRSKLRSEQQELLILRKEWKSSKTLHKSLSAKELNKLVAGLNKSITDWKMLEDWLSRRKEKLQHIEEVVLSDSDDADSNSKKENARRYFLELDIDLKKYGDSLHLDETDTSDIDYMSEVISPIINDKKKSQTYVWQDHNYMHGNENNEHVNRQLHVPSSTRHTAGSLDAVRKVLRDLTNDQRNCEQVYDEHAEWLQSLKKEVAAFQSSKDNTVQAYQTSQKAKKYI